MNKRLFLFNSGFRGLYRENMLRTLMLPSGWINKYRYSDDNTDQELIKTLNNLDEEDLDVTIIYIDRFYESAEHKKYRYYPVRNGKLKSYKRELNRNSFYVELKNFTSVMDIDLFNSNFTKKFELCPKLTDNNPESLKDGIYTILDTNDNLFLNNEMDIQLAWINNVKLISKTKAFAEKLGKGEDVIFIKFNLIENSSEAAIVSDKVRSRYKLTRGSNYKIEVAYYYPLQGIDSNAQRVLKIIPYGHLKIEGTDKIRLNSMSETKIIYISVDQSIKDSQNSLDFEFEQTNNVNIVAPYETIEIKTVIGIKNSAWLSLLLIFFAITSIIINTDFSSGIEINAKWIVDQLFSFRFLAHLFQGAILLLMLKFLGEKIY